MFIITTTQRVSARTQMTSVQNASKGEGVQEKRNEKKRRHEHSEWELVNSVQSRLCIDNSRRHRRRRRCWCIWSMLSAHVRRVSLMHSDALRTHHTRSVWCCVCLWARTHSSYNVVQRWQWSRWHGQQWGPDRYTYTYNTNKPLAQVSVAEADATLAAATQPIRYLVTSNKSCKNLALVERWKKKRKITMR